MASRDEWQPAYLKRKSRPKRTNSKLIYGLVAGLVVEGLILIGLYFLYPFGNAHAGSANTALTKSAPEQLAGVIVATETPMPALPNDTATFTPSPTFTLTATITLTPTITPRPPLPTAPNFLTNDWQNLPVIPVVSPAMKDIYAYGLALGNDPHAFSKVGDCNSESVFYLTPFEDPTTYRLGPYTELEPMIANFAGSFGRLSIAAHTGFGPSSMFAPIWADPAQCNPNEGPLVCEFRLHHPSIAIIGLGTHHFPTAEFESQMRAVIEYSLDHGVVPILSTKVDEEGGDWPNAMVAYLAQQYDVPLWNFWRAAQPLPDHGQPDGIHFYWASNYFDSGYAMSNGWPVRNLGALQALNAVWTTVTQ